MIKNIPITVGVLLFGAVCFSQDTTSAVTPAPANVQTDTVSNNAIVPQTDTLTNNPGVPQYKINGKVEIPLVVAGGAFTLYNFSRISKKTSSDPTYIEGLSKNNVNWFDRWGVHAYDEKIDNASYIPFFVSMPAPLILFVADKKMRKDFFKLTFMYAEAMTITGVLYSAGAGYTDRLRPMVYSSGTPMEKRVLSEQKKSFFAGHVAVVATSTFFMARVIADYHPQSRFKWLYYSLASATTLTTAYLRQQAGEHFPSDIILGIAVGTVSGLLIPSLHKIKLVKTQRLSILPVGGSGSTGGFTALYRL